MRVRSRYGAPLLWVSIAVGLVPGPVSADGGRTLAECEAEARSDIDSARSYWCLIAYSKTSGDRAGALRLVEALQEEFPDSPGPLYGRARIYYLSNVNLAMELQRAAIERYVESVDPDGEAWSRINLIALLSARMALDEAEEQVRLAAIAAEKSGDPELRARLALQQARIDRNRGTYANGWRVLRELELSDDFSRLGGRFQADLYQSLVIAASRLGFRELSHNYKLKMLEVSREHGYETGEMSALSDLAYGARSRIARGEMEPAEALEMARRAVELAERSGNVYNEVTTRGNLASLLDGEAHREQLRKVIEKSESNPFCRGALIISLKELGTSLVDDDPTRLDEGLAHVERAFELANGDGMKTEMIRVLSGLVNLHLEHSPRERAIEAVEQGLRVIESMVDLQSSEGLAATMMAAYSGYYYALVGRILAGAPEQRDVAIAGAFEATETLRARVLRRYLAGVGAGGDIDPQVAEEHSRILKSITEHQIELMTSKLTDERRRTLLDELESLELEADATRFRMRQGDAAEELPPVATLEEIQGTLDSSEALLSFMVSANAGESWLLSITQDVATAYPLPAREELTEAVQLWLGLVSRRDATERFGAARLYDELLEEALGDLPDTVRRLIVVPDGPLHHMPFDALRDTSSELPLVVRYEISLTPSATAWLRLRERAMIVNRPAGALIFADPRLDETAVAEMRSGRSLSAWAPPGALAFSRREGRSVLKSLGGRGRLHVAGEATESRLKSEPLDGYRLLHFATHAFVDGDSPERSAVLLAPGSPEEDGLIQPREVLGLDLDGAIVALSACQTAGGDVLPGEGVMSLGRSFLQAGAVAVIGGLWPLGDRETAQLIDRFYDRLARGEPVATALAEAKRELARSNVPVSDWAGVVAIGAGYQAGWPEPVATPVGATFWIAGVVALAALALAFLVSRRARGLSGRTVRGC